MPAPFFVFRDVGAVNRGVGMPGGIWGFRDAGRCSGFRGAGVSERRCGRVFGGERRGRVRRIAGCSEDCWALGGLPDARRAGEGLVGACAACKRLGGELSGIAGGEGLLAANCRGRRGGVSGAGMLGRGPLESGGRGMLGGDLFGRNLVGCREGAARAACCRLFGSRVEAGRGCSGLCREPKPRESGV